MIAVMVTCRLFECIGVGSVCSLGAMYRLRNEGRKREATQPSRGWTDLSILRNALDKSRARECVD